MYEDSLELHTLGPLTVGRLSRIEYSAAAGQWQVLLPDRAEPAFSHTSRSACLAWEEAHVTALLAAGISPPTFPD